VSPTTDTTPGQTDDKGGYFNYSDIYLSGMKISCFVIIMNRAVDFND